MVSGSLLRLNLLWKGLVWGCMVSCLGLLGACAGGQVSRESKAELERQRLLEDRLREERRQAIEKEQFLMWEEMRK